MTNRTKLALVLITGILLIMGLSVESFLLGRKVERYTNPVCHSISEDSDITDCDYHNGAWYRK